MALVPGCLHFKWPHEGLCVYVCVSVCLSVGVCPQMKKQGPFLNKPAFLNSAADLDR